MGTCETYLFQLRERPLLLWLHTTHGPTERDWERGLALTRSAGCDKVSFIIISDGGGPNTAQRAELQELLGGQELLTAFICDDRIARGIATAISWFNPRIRAFGSRSFTDALAHLQLSPREGQQILHRFSLMQSALPRVETLRLVLEHTPHNEQSAQEA